jgi:hypothetical protein
VWKRELARTGELMSSAEGSECVFEAKKRMGREKTTMGFEV